MSISNRLRLITFLICITLIAVVSFLNVKPAFAFPVPVTVTITHVFNLDQDEEPDFYPYVTINGFPFLYPPIETTDDDLSPNWVFQKTVDSNAGSVPITIDIWDEDLNENDHIDLFLQDGRTLNLNLQLAPCVVSGAVSGICGATIQSLGLEDDKGYIEFQINAVQTGAPGLGVECLHNPIWPQTTDNININARVLDGNLQPNTILADSIKIWRPGDLVNPAKQGSGSDLSLGIGSLPNGGAFTYGCEVKKGTDTVFTGWKTAQVGVPNQGRAIMGMYTADRSHAIDIVFIPDSDDYTGPNDPTFETAMTNIIRTFYGERVFYDNQDKLNFWLSQDLGNTNGWVPPTATTPSICNNFPPANYFTDYAFADAGSIVHTTLPAGITLECAQNKVFSAKPDPSNIAWFRHEGSHAAFNLADEYNPPPNGGYFEAYPWPNLYDIQTVCQADTGLQCRTFNDIFGEDWWTSDPPANDLMVDDGVPRNLDLRKINGIFGFCGMGAC